MSKRTRQIADTIQRILGDVIQQELKDPRVGFATITGVDVTADLQHATVRVSILGDDVSQIETMQGLERARGFLRKRLAEEMRHMRIVPELRLVRDTSLEYTMHIDEVLRQVEHERTVNPPQLDEDESAD
ncbi:MAG: 30S ribosome-binding factor RbfA [Chloroflexaceae bacterium]|nr:30S ribosome-binding factor RbfA [Chloroflexaceae bacterium]NJO07085.1 30S ribosome-binding factor RbfA [Chloroflexaceae bacterium]